MSDNKLELQSALKYVYDNQDLIKKKYNNGSQNAKLIIEAHQLFCSFQEHASAALLMSGVENFKKEIGDE